MLILFLPLPNAAAQNLLSAERDGKSLTEQEQDLTFGGGLAVLHRADIQVVWEANLAHRGHVCHRSGTDTSCPWWLFWGPSASESLPLPHLKVSPPSGFPVSISWWEPRRDKTTPGGGRAQTCLAGIQAELCLAPGVLQRELQGPSGHGDQIQLFKQHPILS